jgi:dienelactone hydrolase
MKSSSQQSAAESYAKFIREQARSRLGPVVIPATLKGWDERLERARAGLNKSFGRMPEAPCPLDPEVLGTLSRPGYAIERLTFQSRPGVRVTANLYRPDPVHERLPAVLSVHGHWSWARMDPHVQPRCIGLAKLGYVVLSVDAFGAGERAIEPAPGTYHGALVGASLWPVGTPLLGLQVYDNRRAVDYLVSRPEVDAGKLAITGASGGGNQTLYAGATDTRLAAVVPVCGVGTYETYLTTACCVCEVNIGGATYATTGDVLALIAPRALLVVSATRDAVQFSVGEASKSVAHARERFRLLGQEAKIRHTAIDSGHDFNQPMRESMYGWLEKWLRGRGDGGPVSEPEVKVEEIETLRCFPAGTPRPKTVVTIPEWVYRQGTARLAALANAPDHIEQWNADAERMRSRLREQILGGFPQSTPLQARRSGTPERVSVSIETERDVVSQGVLIGTRRQSPGTAIIVWSENDQRYPHHNGDQRRLQDTSATWQKAGFAVLETTCRTLPNLNPIGEVPDHTVAEWGLWVGRPLLGQWVWDIIRWLDFLDEARSPTARPGLETAHPERPFVLIGLGTMSFPALLAAGLDKRVSGVACENGFFSFVNATTMPWGIPMGALAPNILEVGDVGHFAALVAPRPLVYTRALDTVGQGSDETRRPAQSAFAFTRTIYELMGAEDRLKLSEPADLRAMLPQP